MVLEPAMTIVDASEPVTTLGGGLTVPGLLSRAVAAVPDEPFLDFEGRMYSFRDVDEQSSFFAQAMVDLGVTRGSTVATMLETSIESIVT